VTIRRRCYTGGPVDGQDIASETERRGQISLVAKSRPERSRRTTAITPYHPTCKNWIGPRICRLFCLVEPSGPSRAFATLERLGERGPKLRPLPLSEPFRLICRRRGRSQAKVGNLAASRRTGHLLDRHARHCGIDLRRQGTRGSTWNRS
jgi:hypothetical protein